MSRMTYQEAMEAIIEFFNGDKDKALYWWMMPNPLLGDLSPFQMVKMGRSKKLMEFIRTSLSENIR